MSRRRRRSAGRSYAAKRCADSLVAIRSANTTATRPLSGSCIAIGRHRSAGSTPDRRSRGDDQHQRPRGPTRAGRRRRAAIFRASRRRRSARLRHCERRRWRRGPSRRRRLHGKRRRSPRTAAPSDGPNRMAIGSVTTRPSSSGGDGGAGDRVHGESRPRRTARRGRRVEQAVDPWLPLVIGWRSGFAASVPEKVVRTAHHCTDSRGSVPFGGRRRTSVREWRTRARPACALLDTVCAEPT